MAGGRSVSFAEVSKRFLVRGSPLAVLDKISLACPPGSFTALIGPSGCGKSTLLRIALGLEGIDEGRVTIGGETPETVRGRGEIGIAFQDSALLPWRSVAGNIALPLDVLGGDQRAAIIARYVKLVGLQGFEGAYPDELSGGMKQRVEVARALAVNPDVLVPAILPQLIVAMRIALGVAWLVVVAAEMIAVNSGLGFLIVDARNAGDRYDLVIAGMVLIGAIGVVLDLLMRRLERLDSVRWGYAAE